MKRRALITSAFALMAWPAAAQWHPARPDPADVERERNWRFQERKAQERESAFQAEQWRMQREREETRRDMDRGREQRLPGAPRRER